MDPFLTIGGLSRGVLTGLLDDADEFVEVLHRPIPKVPALRGKTVATMFFEASTRTKMSFEKAAKALSADTMSFSPGTSSLSKGESLKDTVLTIKAMGTDAMVVRHTATGAPWRIAEWIDQPVLNGGDGAHQHPTQALLDALTIRQHFGTLDGLKIGIVGDIRHSRVARSDIQAFSTLGAEVTLHGLSVSNFYALFSQHYYTRSCLNDGRTLSAIYYCLRNQWMMSWVKQVEAIALKDLDEERAAKFDVVVADWHRRYGEAGYQGGEGHGLKLGRDFKRPVVMIGAVGGELVRDWSKLNWL